MWTQGNSRELKGTQGNSKNLQKLGGPKKNPEFYRYLEAPRAPPRALKKVFHELHKMTLQMNVMRLLFILNCFNWYALSNQKWELGTVFIAKALMYLVVEIEKILLLLHGPVYVFDECILHLIIRDGFSLGNWHIQIGTSQFGIMQSYRLRKVHVRYLLPDQWLLFHWQGSILHKFFNPLTY